MTFLHDEIKTSVDGVCLLMDGQDGISPITYKYIDNIDKKITEVYKYSIMNNKPYDKKYDNIRKLNTIAMFCMENNDMNNARYYYSQIFKLCHSISKNTIIITESDNCVINNKSINDTEQNRQYYDYKLIVNKFKLINELKMKLNKTATDTNRQTATDTNRQMLDTIILNNRIFNSNIIKNLKHKDAPLKLTSMLRRGRR